MTLQGTKSPASRPSTLTSRSASVGTPTKDLLRGARSAIQSKELSRSAASSPHQSGSISSIPPKPEPTRTAANKSPKSLQPSRYPRLTSYLYSLDNEAKTCYGILSLVVIK